LGAGLTAAVTSKYIYKTGHYNIVTWVGWFLVVIGTGILVLLEWHTSVQAWIFMNVVSGLGLGCLFASLPIATQAPQTEENMATAAGLTPFFRTVGQAFGIAIGDAIYQNRLKHYLSHADNIILRYESYDLPKNSASVVAWLQEKPRFSELQLELVAAFDKSLHGIWWVMMGISLFGGVISLFMKELPIDRLVSTASSLRSGSQDVENAIKTDGPSNEGLIVNGGRGHEIG
jgi:MFS family permease